MYCDEKEEAEAEKNILYLLKFGWKEEGTPVSYVKETIIHMHCK